MNLLDAGVLLIFAVCIIICYKRGLIRAVYSLFGGLLSLFLSWHTYPLVSRFLTNTEPIYKFIYKIIENSLDLDTAVAEQSLKVQNELITALHLPDFIIQSLHAGNNPVLYELFKATNLSEYICSYLTAICIDVLALIAAFCVAWVIMRLISDSLNIMARLPIIHGFNSVGGIAIGVVQGLLVVWVAAVIITMLIPLGLAPGFGGMITHSLFAYRFFENNFFLNLVM